MGIRTITAVAGDISFYLLCMYKDHEFLRPELYTCYIKLHGKEGNYKIL